MNFVSASRSRGSSTTAPTSWVEADTGASACAPRGTRGVAPTRTGDGDPAATAASPARGAASATAISAANSRTRPFDLPAESSCELPRASLPSLTMTSSVAWRRASSTRPASSANRLYHRHRRPVNGQPEQGVVAVSVVANTNRVRSVGGRRRYRWLASGANTLVRELGEELAGAFVAARETQERWARQRHPTRGCASARSAAHASRSRTPPRRCSWSAASTT
jgi:hypothetical protein